MVGSGFGGGGVSVLQKQKPHRRLAVGFGKSLCSDQNPTARLHSSSSALRDS
jgi:hypothetical protein